MADSTKKKVVTSSSESSSSSSSNTKTTPTTTTPASSATKITLNINGADYNVSVPSTSMPLLWVLRDIVGLTGTKYGCGAELCGACTVLVNGQPELACDEDVASVIGKKITTVEGLSADPDGRKAQQAWIDCQVPQCGYCQSGVLMKVVGGMKSGNHGAQLESKIGNVCVCGTYQRMKAAVSGL